MNRPYRTLAVLLILIVATATPLALQVEGTPRPTPTSMIQPRLTYTPTMFPSPTCPACCETPALPPRHCPTCTAVPTPAATPYPWLPTSTPRPVFKVYLAEVDR